jgi:hypothetical protein
MNMLWLVAERWRVAGLFFLRWVFPLRIVKYYFTEDKDIWCSIKIYLLVHDWNMENTYISNDRNM